MKNGGTTNILNVFVTLIILSINFVNVLVTNIFDNFFNITNTFNFVDIYSFMCDNFKK